VLELEAQADILLDGAPGQQRGVLEDEADEFARVYGRHAVDATVPSLTG
jgi:hypothetical protein